MTMETDHRLFRAGAVPRDESQQTRSAFPHRRDSDDQD